MKVERPKNDEQRPGEREGEGAKIRRNHEDKIHDLPDGEQMT